MKKSRIGVYALAILLIEAAGFCVGMLTRSGVELFAASATKPPLSPPGILFPIAWGILYALMALSMARIVLSEPSPMREWAIVLFIFQMALNFSWCFMFFERWELWLALIELVSMIVEAIATNMAFRKVDSLAARLQIPYIAWLCFAAYLNLGVCLLN